MQELITILSIILGVIVLTAWAMWITLRPSGDNKVEAFASKSTRDGLTQTMVENNELKNTVSRLERELEVLKTAGSGQNAKKSKKPKAAKKDSKELKAEREVSEMLQAENILPKTEVLKPRSDVKPSEELKAKWKGVAERGTIKDQRSLLRADKVHSKKSEFDGLKIKDYGLSSENKGKRKEAVSVRGSSSGKGVPKTAELIQSSDVSALAESQRITNKKEKKKIAAYLASVAETTERQMKEVEALEEEIEVVVEAIQYPDEDLKKIKGIGLHLEGKLKKTGISSYQQIADLNDVDMKRVAKEIGYFPRRIKRDEWVEQAKKLC